RGYDKKASRKNRMSLYRPRGSFNEYGSPRYFGDEYHDDYLSREEYERRRRSTMPQGSKYYDIADVLPYGRSHSDGDVQSYRDIGRPFDRMHITDRAS